MNNTMFGLEQKNIQLSNKIITMFATETPEYLLFINNRAETNNVKNQLNSYLYFNKEYKL